MELSEIEGIVPRRPSPEARWPEPSETSVVVVDDEPAVLKVLVRFLEGKGYQVRPFESSLEARDAIRTARPDLLLTDRRMPGIDGIELAKAALEEDPNLPVVMLTGAGDAESAAEGLRIGLVDYLLKPPSLEVLDKTLWRALVRRTQADFHQEAEAWMREELDFRTKEAVLKAQQLEDVTVGAFSSLVRILEGRSPHYRGHSEAVASLSEVIAKECQLLPADITVIRAAGLLHDIGMIAIPDALIEKASPLSAEEASQVQGHCWIGADILRPFTHMGPVSEFVLSHHERVDGSGYPKGLKGEEIPLGAQIIGAADTYCAMTEARPFRPAGDPETALDRLREAKDSWFSADVIEALEIAVGKAGNTS